MGQQLGGTPVLVLKEGSERSTGRDAQTRNIQAAKTIGSSIRTTLGPRGMDKMLVDSTGDVTISNDGVTLLKEMDIEHPGAKMIVEVAKTVDEDVGDGTTTAVILAGELLKGAEDLINQEVHSTVITSGYRMAAEKAYEILKDVSYHISPDDTETLKKVAMTSMTGKGAEVSREKLAELAVEACRRVCDEDGTIDPDNVKVEKRTGAGVDSSELIDGIVIDKEVVHPGMPEQVKNAKIALINAALEVEKTEVDAKIQIKSPDQLRSFLDEEESMMRDKVEKIKESGANIVLCQKGIDDLPQHYLAKEGILAARRIKKSDMEKLARATGARIVTNIDEISPEDLGNAGSVEQRKIADEEMLFIRECENPTSVSVLIRGGSEHVIDEVERGFNDAIRVVALVMEDGYAVPGGSASEVDLAMRLREHAATIGGREQLAIEAFADALETVPRTLAENAGLDPIDQLVALRSEHEKGGKSMGLDVYGGKVIDMIDAGAVEPARVKHQAISSAVEAANMILRIDDVISSKEEEKPAAPGGAPPGMPETGAPPGGHADYY